MTFRLCSSWLLVSCHGLWSLAMISFDRDFFIPLLDLVCLLDFSLPFGLKTLFLNLVSSWLFSLHDFWSLFMTFGLSSWLRSFFMTFGLSSWLLVSLHDRSFFMTFGLSSWLRFFFMTFGLSSWLLVLLVSSHVSFVFFSSGVLVCLHVHLSLYDSSLNNSTPKTTKKLNRSKRVIRRFLLVNSQWR